MGKQKSMVQTRRLKAAPSVGRVYPAGWWNIIGPTGLCVSARNNNGRLVQQRCGGSADLSWTMLQEEETTETPSSDTEETIPLHKSGLSNQSDTEITYISEISKETNAYM